MREVILLNDEWLFTKDEVNVETLGLSTFDDFLDNHKLEKVNVPHTWNNLDGQDGGGDYFRSVCTYVKTLNITKEDLTKDLYLQFEAVFSISNVYINNKHASHHEGGFQTFRVRLNDFVTVGENLIVVTADNRANDTVYPQFADFTFFGGIYRNVSLIKTSNTHFDLDHFGSKGIKLTPTVLEKGAKLVVETYITNPNDKKVRVSLINDDKILETKDAEALENNTFEFELEEVHLWHGTIDPHLYKVEAVILDDETILDNICDNCGFRTFRVDPNLGFFLNGKPYHLHGVSRHQDRLDLGWALTTKEHDEDMELIREVGANTIRLAHYQHDQYFYDLCDKYGMVVWAEIPYISAHMDTGRDNVFSQMKELIIQNYNHTSIVCWGLSNEITMRGETERLIQDHKDLNDYVHQMDPTRLTTMAEISMVKMTSPMTRITDIISYNHYFGWYAGKTSDNGPWLDKFHELNPDICCGLSEYGCEAILDYHTDDPKQGDYSEEYQSFYHEEMLKCFAERPFIWSTHVWNMFDFAADLRDEGGKKGRNHKGLVTFDRKTRKDSFYIYKAYWSDEKFVHICSKRYLNRSKEDIKITVYSNLDEVEVLLNDTKLELVSKEPHKFVFAGKLVDGENKVVALSGEYRDEAVFNKVETEDLSYHFNSGLDSVTNWFEDGEEKKFNLPEGYYNVNHEIGEIMDNPTGAALMMIALHQGGKKMGMSDLGEDMFNMVRSMTVARVVNLAGLVNKQPKLLYQVNELLNKLKIGKFELNQKENKQSVIIKNHTYVLNMPEGYLNINSKIKDLLKHEFTFNLLNMVLGFKGMDLNKIGKFKKFIIGQARITSILNKLDSALPEDILTDINNILITIKK